MLARPNRVVARVRALMLAQIRGTTLVLRSLESHDVDAARVQTAAAVVTTSRADAKLERIVGRLSRDPTIVAASWRVSSAAPEAAAEAEE